MGMWKEHGYWVRDGTWAYCDEEQATALIDRLLKRTFAERPIPDGQVGEGAR